jgi:hypothetical protein
VRRPGLGEGVGGERQEQDEGAEAGHGVYSGRLHDNDGSILPAASGCDSNGLWESLRATDAGGAVRNRG